MRGGFASWVVRVLFDSNSEDSLAHQAVVRTSTGTCARTCVSMYTMELYTYILYTNTDYQMSRCTRL
jgi:hypothetical protein